MPDLPDWSQALPPHLLASGSTTPPGPTDLTVDLQGEQTLFIDASNPFSVDVVGATTGLIYPASVADGGTCYVPVSPVDDPTVDITLNDTLGLGLDYVIRGIPSDIRRLVLQAAVQDVILKAQAPAGSGTVLLSTDVGGDLLVAEGGRSAKQLSLVKTGVASPGGSFSMGTVPASTAIRGALVTGNIVGTGVGGASASVGVLISDGVHTIWLAQIIVDEGGSANQVRRFEPPYIPSDLTGAIWTAYLNIGTINRLGAAIADAFGALEY